MNEIKHPTHLRTTIIGGVILGLIIISSMCIGFYSQEKLNNQDLSEFCGNLFFFCIVLSFFWVLFRTYLCRCPSCKGWLFKQYEREYNKPRKFICNLCETIWDSGIVVENDD